MQLATNERKQIRPPANIDYNGLTFSPDGEEIFFVTLANEDGQIKSALHKMPAGGGEAATVLSDVGDAISFAPDGAQFAFVRLSNMTETALMVANVDGSGERVIATRKEREFLGRPAWSPDRNLIACASAVIRNKSREVGVMGFDLATGEE